MKKFILMAATTVSVISMSLTTLAAPIPLVLSNSKCSNYILTNDCDEKIQSLMEDYFNCITPPTENNICNNQNSKPDNNFNDQNSKPDNNFNDQNSKPDNNFNDQNSKPDNNFNDQNNGSVSTFEQKVVDLINVERAKEGLAPLSIDLNVVTAARVRAEEIKKVFSHTRPDGSSCFTALDEANASYKSAGENIALGQTSPEQVVTDWMNSPGHRANIMDSKFQYIGVGVSGTAWVQMFTS